MKVRSLQFGKAMSAALFVLLLVILGTKNALAQTQVASLQHGDDVSVYYGGNAFVEAYSVAQTGDIITLSSGTFVPCDITKAITLRGAGCAVDTEAGTNPTLFGGTITLNVVDTVNCLTIEGILFTSRMSTKELHSPKFNRCNFTEVYGDGGSTMMMYNAQFTNCIINKFDFYYCKNTVLINSVLSEPNNIDNYYQVVLYNSIMKIKNTHYGVSAYNSIVFKTENSYPSLSCTFVNCIGIDTYTGSSSYGPFGQGYTIGCATYTSYEEVFESFTGEFSLEESFSLKDEIATGFLGTDGTQVGIYGGSVPYSFRPFYMTPVRYNVANKSNNEGKLNVEIEVITGGE